MIVVENTAKKKSGNTNSSSFLNFSRTESSMVQHMELSIYKTTCDNRTLKKTVLIFKGYEYTFTYYDAESSCAKTVTGLVEDIADSYITLKYLITPSSTSDADICVTTGMPVCGCILNTPNTDKYNTTATAYIPISNITDIAYVRGGTNPVPNKPKKGVIVVLLGISATIVRAVAINLKMINDNCSCEDAVVDINLVKGGIYTIAYRNEKTGTIYEFDGKLVGILETSKEPSKCTIVRGSEQCGLNNSIYNGDNDQRQCGTECNCGTDKDQYLLAEPMKNDVMLTFDTSSDFTGELQTIMLSWIRDCNVIQEPVDTDGDEENNTPPDCSCCTCNQNIEMTSNGTVIVLDPKTKEIKYDNGTYSDKVSLQEVMDFYFGCSC